MSELTIFIRDSQSIITAKNIKDAYVYQISSITENYGLAFSDDNWARRTILVSRNYEDLLSKERAINLAIMFNSPTVYI